MMLMSSVAEMLSVTLIFPLMKVYSDPSVIDDWPVLQSLFDLAGAETPSEFVLFLALGLLCAILCKNVFVFFTQFLLLRFVWDNVARLGAHFLREYVTQSLTFHFITPPARMIRNVTFSIPAVMDGMILPWFQLLAEIFVLTGILFVLLSIAPTVTFGALGLLFVVVLVAYLPFRKNIAAWGLTVNSTYEKMLTTTEESLRGIQQIKLNMSEDYFVERFERELKVNCRSRYWTGTISQVPRLALETGLIFGVVGFLFFSVSTGEGINEALPILAVFAMAALRVLPSFNRITQNLNRLGFNEGALNDLLEDWTIFDETLSRSDGHAPFHRFESDITFQDVGYAYSKGKTVLDKINFRITKNEWVALIGPSGSGKTTIVKLLAGLLSPDNGTILVDDEPPNVHSHSWREQFAYIPQDTFIFSGTIAENIRFGGEDTDENDQRLFEAIRVAQLSNVVDRLPEGIRTHIGKNGAALSGGEAQRLGIARAIYHAKDILVMDEVTSALDTDTEESLVQALKEASKDKTVIMIAHRLTTIKNCDRILMIDGGNVVGEGRYQDLEAKNKKFSSLVAEWEPDGTPVEEPAERSETAHHGQ